MGGLRALWQSIFEHGLNDGDNGSVWETSLQSSSHYPEKSNGEFG